MTPKEWLEWIDGAEANKILGLSPMRELLADWTADRERLLPLVRVLRNRLRDLMSYPAAMAQIGPISKGLAEGAIFRADAALAEPQEGKEESRE